MHWLESDWVVRIALLLFILVVLGTITVHFTLELLGRIERDDG